MNNTDFMPVKTDIVSAFNAPVYYMSKTDSTMTIAQHYADEGAAHGSFFYADTQTAGRGRLSGRQWLAPAGEAILGTLLLKQAFESGFSLKIGLAVSMMLDRYLPPTMQTAIKWPNDVLIGGKKAAGILCTMHGTYLLAGIGINIFQKNFPPPITDTAVSLAAVIGREACPERTILIQQLLSCIYSALSNPCWHTAVSKKLWKKNETIRFMDGAAAQNVIEGTLQGISSHGALVIHTAKGERLCYSGEILLENR